MIDLVTVRHVGAATHGNPVIHSDNMIDPVSVPHVVAQLHWPYNMIVYFEVTRRFLFPSTYIEGLLFAWP